MAEMEYRTLGRTGLTVSGMGLGSGGPSRLGQRRGTSVGEVRTLLTTAIELGINAIDTAPGYGASEALLGEALAGMPRDELVISTKFHPFDPAGQIRRPDDLLASLDASLTHLGTDRVEIFYLHAVPAGATDETMDVFAEPLREAAASGRIRFTGLSEAYANDHDHEALQTALHSHDFDVIMVGYNLMSPSAAVSVLPLAADRDVGVVVMCAVRGVIAVPERLDAVVQKWKRTGLLHPDDLPDTDPLGWLLDEADSIAAAAYKFAAEPTVVGCVLTGTASPGHLRENVAALTGPPLSHETVTRLNEVFGKVGRNVGPADAQ